MPGEPEHLSFVPHDTSADAYQAQLECYRRMTGAERTAIVFRLIATARRLAEAGIRERHPDYDDAKAHRAFLRLRLGDQAARDVWPGEALVDP
jgi:hypothetical protein